MSMAWGFLFITTKGNIILNNMKLKEEFINTIHYIKGLDRNVKIDNNPMLFNFYLTIGLDFIFEKNDTVNKRKHK